MEKVLFDCDNTMGLPLKEIDDGLTLLYLLGRPDIELLGVTTTFGNGSLEQVNAQTQGLLAAVGRQDIPLYPGASQRNAAPTRAAHFLVERASAQPGEISLLATGPLGNLRAAAQLDPYFWGNLKRIVCMGGYLAPLRIGWRSIGELNLSADPQASWQVLNAPCTVTLMSAQLCRQAAFGWSDLGRLRSWRPAWRKAVRNWLLVFGLYCGTTRFYLWDLVPAVYLSHPELFDTHRMKVVSGVQDLEKGKLLLGGESGPPLVNLPQQLKDPARFNEILFASWQVWY